MRVSSFPCFLAVKHVCTKNTHAECGTESRCTCKWGVVVALHPQVVAIAQRPAGGVLASAEQLLSCNRRNVHKWLESCSYMRPIAPRLLLAQTASAPPIHLALLAVNKVRVCCLGLRLRVVRPPLVPHHRDDRESGKAKRCAQWCR